jgi:hypothetical protein
VKATCPTNQCVCSEPYKGNGLTCVEVSDTKDVHETLEVGKLFTLELKKNFCSLTIFRPTKNKNEQIYFQSEIAMI